MKVKVKQKVNEADSQTKRRCPGEKYEVSPAICKARQANRYPKCLLCSFYSGDPGAFSTGDPKVKKNIFRSNAIAGVMPDEINEYVMRKVGSATGQFLKVGSSGKAPVLIACDRRENSRNLSRIFGEGMKSAGKHAIHLGPAMPDMLRFALREHGMDAAAFISGCNAKAEVNGVRIFAADGSPMLFESGIEKIGLIARRMKPGRSKSRGKSQTMRVLPGYHKFITSHMPELRPMKVVIDGSEGVGGEIIPHILRKTPLSVIKSHCEPNPRSDLLGLRFPAGQVNTSVQQAIHSEHAHLGMATDYDGDMCTFYEESGKEIRNDIAAALIAGEVLHRKPGARIAYDLRSSAAFREEILRNGGHPIRTSPASGRMNNAIISKGAEYAFDLSGRHFFKSFSGGESPLMALLLLCSAVSRSQRSLSAMADKVQRYSYSGILTHEMPSQEKAAGAVEKLCSEFSECEIDDLDGLTFRFSSWWFHVKSAPESRIIKICVEGPTERDERKGRRAVEDIIRKYQHRR